MCRPRLLCKAVPTLEMEWEPGGSVFRSRTQKRLSRLTAECFNTLKYESIKLITLRSRHWRSWVLTLPIQQAETNCVPCLLEMT